MRAVGRTAQGVKGVTLAGPEDEVVGMVVIVDGSKDVLVVEPKWLWQAFSSRGLPDHQPRWKRSQDLERYGKDGRIGGHFGRNR